MTNNKKTIINIVTSGFQVALIGVIYYFLYRILLEHLGIKLLGVWSVVMSASSVANIADLGIATSIVRFVTLYDHTNRKDEIPQLIYTGVVLNILIFVPICFIIWPIAYYFLENIIELKYVSVARELLPFSLVCVLLNSIAGVYGSILDGYRKNYIRNTIFSLSSFVFLFLSVLGVKKYGVMGVVYAQIFQSSLSLIMCIILSVRIVRFNPVKYNWNKNIFKEIFNYGLKFQMTSITGILNEPVTKMLMAKFGGLAFTGYYEMATKLVMQIRGVIISANQSLMPIMVKESLNERETPRFSVLSLSFIGVFFLSMYALTYINITAPIISEVWIGHRESIFINILLIVSFSMFINLLSAPNYFTLLSINKLNAIIISQLIMAVCNISISFILGYFFKGYGIVFTWMIVVLIGSWYLIQSLPFKNTLNLFLNIKLQTFVAVFFNIIFIVLSKLHPEYIYFYFSGNIIVFYLISISIIKKIKKLIII